MPRAQLCRRAVAAIAMLLMLLVSLLPTSRVAQAAAPWVATAPPPKNTGSLGSALLPDGQVFVRGNQVAQRYDPRVDRWTLIAQDLNPQGGPALTTLLNGDVLVVGGMSCGHCGSGNVERYAALAGTLTRVAGLRGERGYHTATTLADGRVLVAGGMQGLRGPYATTELYDPATDIWIAGPPMTTARAQHTATRLADGRVLVVGGALLSGSPWAVGRATAELYDPATNRWTAATAPASLYSGYTVTLLADGRVLAIGGAAAEGPALATAERYDPTTDTWTTVAPVPGGRIGHAATALPDGSVLLTGGGVGVGRSGVYPALSTTFRYDPVADSWRDADTMLAPHRYHDAILLLDGSVLVIGADTAERYADSAVPRCFVETKQCIQGRFLAHWQGHGGLAVNGYPLSAEFVETLEDGKPYTVQYFERVRLEYHPESADPRYQVLLGQFGRRIHPADAPAPPAPGTRYFAETGHNLGGSFQRHWEANGGLAQFGYPLTEEFTATLEDGKPYTVQYFERARFEYHPENRAPYDVLLGQFGRQILGGR